MINLEKVCYQIENTKILTDITISLEQGEKIAIIGSNGCGKSTLVKLIDALIFPTCGSVEIFGFTSKVKNKHQIHKKIGYLFQHPSSYFVGSTVKEDIAFTLDNFDIPKEKWDGIIKNVLEKVKLEGFENRLVSTLSGGEAQKVALSSSLAIDVDLIILDEATSSLDEQSKKDVLNCIFEYTKDKSLISITHTTNSILNFDKVIAMKGGAVVAFGKAYDILTDIKLLASICVEPPFAVKTYYELKNRGIALPFIPLTEDELEEALCL